MGKTATVFKDIGKTCSDLLTKDYKTGKNSVEVKSKTSNGVTFTPTAELAGTKFSGSLKAAFAVMGIDTETTLNTGGTVASKFEMADALAKGACLTFETETADKGNAMLKKALCTLDYKTELFTCKSSYDYFKSQLTATASCVYDGFTLGCSADYGITSGALATYATACQFVQPDFTLVAKLESKKDGAAYTGMYYHKVSGDMQVGTELVKKSSKAGPDLAFGCMFKLDKDTTIKSKVDSEGILSASYKQKISPITTMTLAATIDTVKMEADKNKFGMALAMTV
jgi:voltage-dependent anion channel protein 2